MFGWLAKLLAIIYGYVPSYGGSIVLFTLLIMIALLPLTLKGTRSMLALQQLQPEIKKLQARYKDDRQKLNEETMKFYQENKISPFGGCLPLLVQMPVFFVLYEVLLGLTRRGPFGQDLGASVGCSMAGTASSVCGANGVFESGGFFDPKYISHSTKLFQDLSQSRVMGSFGLDLSQSAMKAIGSGFMHALPYIVMVLVVVLATWYQQRQMQSRTPATSQNPQQQLMMQVMPLVFGFIYLVIPAGVVVYFLASGLFRIAQQGLVTRTMYGEGSAGAEILARAKAEAEAAGPQPKKSWREMLMPPAESRPQVGKKAAERKTPGATGSDKGSSRTTAGKASSKGTAKSSAAKQGGAKKGGSKQAAGQGDAAEPTPAKRAADRGRAKASPAEAAPERDQTTKRAPGTRSGAAPSRKAPTAAPQSGKNGKKKR